MKTKQRSTAELFRKSMIRLGARPIIVDGQPVQPPKAKRPAKPGGNGARK